MQELLKYVQNGRIIPEVACNNGTVLASTVQYGFCAGPVPFLKDPKQVGDNRELLDFGKEIGKVMAGPR